MFLVAGPAVLLIFYSRCSASNPWAPAISPALIEQAKKMSPAQREALARQYGIPLGGVLGGVSASGDAYVEEQVPQAALQRPREFFDREPVGTDEQPSEDDQLPRFGQRTLCV